MPRIPRSILIIAGLLVLMLVAIYFVGTDAIRALADWLNANRTPEMLLYASLIYTVLLALPGVPGLEIGLVMILVFRLEGAAAMYVSAVLGLNLAFMMGRLLPTERLKRLFRKKSDAVDDGEDGMEKALRGTRFGRFLLRFLGHGKNVERYVMVFFLFNLPGNFILGGGGGIGMLCGTNRNFRWVPYGVTVLIAALPIPLLALGGLLQFEP